MELIATACELIRWRLSAFSQNIDRTDEEWTVAAVGSEDPPGIDGHDRMRDQPVKER
ncbi:MAG: hypothetical protein JWQ94_4164 [Tardiphaga sp.]|nr:hypothetical protein [Tardiphaga sp.]